MEIRHQSLRKDKIFDIEADMEDKVVDIALDNILNARSSEEALRFFSTLKASFESNKIKEPEHRILKLLEEKTENKVEFAKLLSKLGIKEPTIEEVGWRIEPRKDIEV